ncbi:Protein FAR1-RELATED SEQUENCE 5 [Ananas comosus]|uniref:Protein FAR1-RELATED SEQUENCE 5 n=1 Tax=Ananas comosus TaxID=4615 RepID=A0A199W0P1_ANACO|nr:Protein FAR1-RELATED SEQUENCE 5 [Ananas comosus]
MREYGSTIGSSVSLCNIDVENEVNEELEQIATAEQICMSTQPIEEPRVGLEFNSIEDGKKFYNDYAFKMGFSIRKTYHYKSKKHDDAITSVTYCCAKAGLSKSQTHEKGHCQNSEGSNTPKKQFSNRRSGCKAHIVLRIDDRGKWMITVVANEHNHELIISPSKSRFFRSQRAITEEQKELIHMMNEQNISTSQIMAFMQAREGGRHNIHFTRKDLKDFMTKDGEPSLWSDDPIEKDARRIYTRNIFSEFKTQLRATTGYKLIELKKDSLYKISPISHSSTSRQWMCT